MLESKSISEVSDVKHSVTIRGCGSDISKTLLLRGSLPTHDASCRLQARTPLLALVDVDMLMGGGLFKDLREDGETAKQVRCVIPQTMIMYDWRGIAFIAQ